MQQQGATSSSTVRPIKRKVATTSRTSRPKVSRFFDEEARVADDDDDDDDDEDDDEGTVTESVAGTSATEPDDDCDSDGSMDWEKRAMLDEIVF